MSVRQLYAQTLADRGYRSDPAQLRAIDALERCETEWADYKARPSDNDILAFRAFAGLDHGHADLPRIGLRGTAQIYGDWMPLAVVLLRRPISSARQWFGI